MTLDLQTLERWLWDSADIPRGSTDSSDWFKIKCRVPRGAELAQYLKELGYE